MVKKISCQDGKTDNQKHIYCYFDDWGYIVSLTNVWAIEKRYSISNVCDHLTAIINNYWPIRIEIVKLFHF